MKNLYLIILLFLTAISQAQIVNIPDANFKNALINEGVDTNIDGEIQVSEAEAVSYLDVRNNSISSLEGIQTFINLEGLDCSDNQLISLDITQNTNIFWLECNDNYITSLDVTQNPNLLRLWCDVNQLTSLDVTQNPNLKWLWIADNQLTILDVSQNPNLERLICPNNLLTSVDVTQNPNLKWLNYSNNQLTSLDVTQNPGLESLYCSDTQLTSLDVSYNPTLYSLLCQENQLLTSLNIKNGNNINMARMWAYDNPNLLCIQVDDESATYPTCDLVNYNGWCKDSTAVYSEDCVLGLEDNNSIVFTMFPNPVQNVLNIESKVRLENIKIYSLQGQLIKEVFVSSLDVSALPNGLYFARVSIEGKTQTKKFIKS